MYCEINYIATLRLVDKFDRPSEIEEILEKQDFRKFEKELGKMREDMYEKIAFEYLNGDIYEALQVITRDSSYFR